MAERKIPKDSSESLSEEQAEELRQMKREGGFGARIALRQGFKEKLDLIAKHLDTTPGAIIEARLRRFVKAEYPKAVKKEREALDATLQDGDQE